MFKRCIEKSKEINRRGGLGYIYKKTVAILQRKRIICKTLLEVCSFCQYSCNDCAHGGLRSAYYDYQLSLDELKKIIFYIKKSNYYINILQIHGPGEPLLWKYFNEGIRLLYHSNLIDKIIVTTNGVNLNIINETSWKYIYSVNISNYFSSEMKCIEKNMNKIQILDKSSFKPLPKKEYKDSLPSRCTCSGPMFIKDRIFLYCGPPVFDAAKLMGKNIDDFPETYCNLGLNFMDNYDEQKGKYLELCKYCWANCNIKNEVIKHTFK